MDASAGAGDRWWRGARARLWAVAFGAGLAAVALVALVAGIATRSSGDVAAGSDPAGLAGVWRVSEADDPTAETWLWLRPDAPGLLDLWRACGRSSGAWDASRTGFLALIEGGSGGCDGVGGEDGPRWLTAAASYAATDGGWQLRDAAGEVLATLTADEPPGFVREAVELSGGSVVATARLTELLAEPPPLPSGLGRAAPHDLVGAWVLAPGGGPRGAASLDVRADGTWLGSDGCNGTRGRWRLEDGGRLLVASSGETTLEDCPGDDVDVPLALAGRAGFDGDVLVLLDGQGEELVRLVRDTGEGVAEETGEAADADESDDGEASESDEGNDPLGLVGFWRVTGVDDPSAESWLWLGDDSGVSALQLWRPCGWSYGSWDAGPRAFVGAIGGISETCADEPGESEEWEPSWLGDVAAYAATEDGWALLDDAGEPVATLAAGTPPVMVTETPDGPEGPPAVTDAVRQALAEPAPLPTGLVAPTTADLLGRWVPVGGPYPTDPHVTFYDRRWDGSDGCNAVGARWAVDGDGRLFSAPDVGTTYMWCEGDGTAFALIRTERLGLDRDAALVLLDASGVEIGRLERP